MEETMPIQRTRGAARRWLAGAIRPTLTLAVVAVAAAFAAVALRSLPQAIDLLDYPLGLDYGEGVVLSQVRRLAEVGNLYPASDRTGPGFVGAMYPPLYYLLLLVTPDSPASIYTDGRLWSFAGYLATAVLAGLLVGWRRPAWPAGLMTAAAVLALPPAREWGGFAKPDLVALAFSTAGLALVTLSPQRALLAAPLFALGLLTKQSMVAAPAAAVLALALLHGRWRSAIALAGLTGLLVAVPLGVLELGPEDVTWHLLLAQSRGWVWERFDNIGLRFLEIYRPMLAVALTAIALAVWRRRPNLPALYLPLALLTLLASGAPGSSRNHALEAGLALALASGAALVEAAASGPRWRPLVTGSLVALLAWQAAIVWTLPERDFGRRPPLPSVTARHKGILNFLKSEADGPVLSEDIGLLVQAGLPVEYHDPSLMQKMADAGHWDEQPLVDAINDRRYTYILTEGDLVQSPERAGRWTAETVAAIRANYRVLFRDVLTIYEPRKD
jgi:hypothetical protein